MLRRVDLRGGRAAALSARDLSARLPRAQMDIDAALSAVTPVIEDVRDRGAAAVRDAAERFDGIRPEHLRVPQRAIDEALTSLDPDVRGALELCIEHNRAGHRAQLPSETSTEVVPGGWVRQRWVPVARVGLYVPGGLAVYPSSVVMNAVAAQVAGVSHIALASPPQKENGGLPHPTILAACALLGIDEVYAVGGAQAIAMFAYGAAAQTDADRADCGGETLCEPVDVVTGPGNIYVAAAKRAVRGVVGIDAEAGPTEIAIMADSSATPAWVAADLLSQAEHDPQAGSVLITDDAQLADEVDEALSALVDSTVHSERARTALEGPQSGIVLVDSRDEMRRVADSYAAEHLEIHMREAAEMATQVRNAGAIFVGNYSPVPLGDYLAGSNHVLPTGGTARFASGLSVMAFIKPVQVIEYSQQALAQMAAPLHALAYAEDLPAHAHAVEARAH